MKLNLTLYFFLFVFICQLSAQTSFIKQIDNITIGTSLKVLPTDDVGWAIYSKEQTKLIKFNLCGDINWTKSYDIPNATSSLSDIIKTQDGGFAILGREQIGDTHGMRVTKLSSNGDISWSKSYSNLDYDYYPYSISEDNQGNLFLYGNLTQLNNLAVNNHVSKLSNSGDLILTQLYNFGGIWGGAISTSDNGVLFRTGSNFIKLNTNLQVEWKTSIEAPTYHYIAPLEVSNGYIFSANNLSNGTISYYKLDLSGNLLWGGRKNTNQNGIPNALRLNSEGAVVGLYSSTINGENYSTIRVFDASMNLISEHTINQVDLNPRDICFLSNSNPLFIGSSGPNTVCTRLYSNYESNCSMNSSEFTINSEAIGYNQGDVITNNHSLNATSFNPNSSTEEASTIDLCSIIKVLDLGKDTVLCVGSAMVLENISGDDFDVYQWSTGENNSSITIYEPGVYWLVVEDFCDLNRANDTLFIEILPSLSLDFGEDLLVCQDSTQLLRSPQCDSCSFVWSDGSQNDSLQVITDGLYWLEAQNKNGCITSDSILIEFAPCECNVFIPNSFTPNDDGKNDTFKPKFYCDFEDYSIEIFNRWGELIFKSNNPSEAWDGKVNSINAQSGLYACVVKYTSTILNNTGPKVIKHQSISLIE